MEQTHANRDFSSVSTSAKWMILWKGYTTIPYAREVAELLSYPEPYITDFNRKDFTFWASTFGLERRYRSIDQLLNEVEISNILELSSGYSFRCLDYVRQKNTYYIDTDLSDIISTKKEFLSCLTKDEFNINGKLELNPLNVLDETDFHKMISHFPSGEIAIVNEGLLGYLDKEEKIKLCSVIHDILMECGGCWITADIGLKNKDSKLGLEYNDEIKEFNNKQNTEKNSFETYNEAELFFSEMGFVIDKVAKVKFSEISSFKYMVKSMSFQQMLSMITKGKQIQATWRLKAV